MKTEHTEKRSIYGSIADLPDEELADPDELERQMWIREFEPILNLPEPQRRSGIRPNFDEQGRLDWGAFGTVDFDRYRTKPDRTTYQIQQLHEELRDLVIRIDIVSQRIPGLAKYKVLKYLGRGMLDLDEVVDDEMRTLGSLYLQSRRLLRRIGQLKERRDQNAQARLRKLLAFG
jgi:hypothetical protein